MDNARMIFIHALSPLHPGIGQGVGVIDLPIAREKATGLPYLPGSSVKGTLRASCSGEQCVKVFGRETNSMDDTENASSAAQFSDQRLLFLPLRSLAGTFAWVTCPYVLHRFLRDVLDAQSNSDNSQHFRISGLESLNKESCLIALSPNESAIVLNGQTVYLEDLDLSARKNDEIAQLTSWIAQQVFPDQETWRTLFNQRVCVVHNDVFNFFLNTATEITARIKLVPNTKTVQEGGLWYEEALPSETILAGFVLANPQNPARISVKDTFSVIRGLVNKTVQFGGKATVGRGMCRIQMQAEAEN